MTDLKQLGEPGAETYTTRGVAEILEMSVGRIRQYVRAGLVHPLRGNGREFRFTFRDIVVLRTAKGLLDARIPVRRANRALRKLKLGMDQQRSLTSLRIRAEGTHVVVRDANAVWDAESGQGHFDFDAAPAAAADNVEPIFRGLPMDADEREMTTDDWYNLGLDLEDVSPRDAPAAYRKSIDLDPENVDAWVNLGRLLQLEHRLDEAQIHYEHAVQIDHEHELAIYNLGTIHDESGDHAEAMGCYHRAPSIADAHYNLARLYEMQGNQLAAARHMRRYGELVDL